MLRETWNSILLKKKTSRRDFLKGLDVNDTENIGTI